MEWTEYKSEELDIAQRFTCGECGAMVIEDLDSNHRFEHELWHRRIARVMERVRV